MLAASAIGYQAHSQSSPDITLKPFVAHKKIDFFPASSTIAPRSSDVVFARRSDGSYVHSYTTISPRGETGWAAEISDLAGRRFAFLEPFTKSVSTFYLTDRAITERRLAQDECRAGDQMITIGRSQSSDSGQKMIILGRRVESVVQRSEVDTVERLVAPELNCHPLRESVTFPEGGRNETRVLALEDGEPPASLFQIPTDYIERSPTEMEAAYSARYPGHALWGEKMAQTLEQRYKSNRQH
jgi:hypothetical protein